LLYILVAGGPCTGKTTLVKYLARTLGSMGLKVYVIRDWARELIKEGKKSGGPLPWNDRLNFEIEVAKKHLEDFKRALRYSPDIIIEDSGPIATIAYCNVDGLKLPAKLENDIKRHGHRVDLVFITEPNSDYFRDNERWEERDYAFRIHKEIMYTHLNILERKRVILLKPAKTPQIRVRNALNYILSMLKDKVKIYSIRS